ncbi:hypothetical protein EU800_23225 [Tropicimonas sp. IMCC6043]|nr:hypothetical protein EU800_23225 [Tropicimonas sp. IMCC6043]
MDDDASTSAPTLTAAIRAKLPVTVTKRDYIRVNPLPDAETVLALLSTWIGNYNDNHPHSVPKWRSSREFIRAQTETA